MTLQKRQKPAEDVTFYTADWTQGLTTGETIVSATWTAEEDEDSDLSIDSSAVSDGIYTTVWVSAGGEPPRMHRVRCTVETSLGRTLTDSFLLEMIE